MHTKEYEEYLKSPEWRYKRLLKAGQAKYTCEICGKVVKRGFHVHHKTYRHFMDEPLSDLMFLCEDCHMKLHEKRNKLKEKKNNRVKKCCNCKFSQIITVGIEKKRVLFCSKYLKVCGHRCEFHEPGKWKNVNKHHKKKQKQKAPKK